MIRILSSQQWLTYIHWLPDARKPTRFQRTPLMNAYRISVLMWFAIVLAVRADGPSGNVADKVRSIPPAGGGAPPPGPDRPPGGVGITGPEKPAAPPDCPMQPHEVVT